MQILTTIGIILLILVGIFVALLLLVLFFPIAYKAEVRKQDGFSVSASVKWLFGFLSIPISFSDGKPSLKIQIAGFSLNSRRKKKQTKKTKKRKKAKKQPIIMPGEKPTKQVSKDAKAAAKAETKVLQGKAKPSKEIYEEGEAKGGKSFKEKISSFFEKVRTAAQLGFGYSTVKKKSFKILKHVLPKKIRGTLLFGFNDPSATGKAFGLICAVYPIIPADLTLVPEFAHAAIECDLKIKGRIYLIYLVVMGLRIYFSKEGKALIKQLKK